MPEATIQHITCIECPRGCYLELKSSPAEAPTVSGHACPRGEKYGLQELVAPMRTLTTTVKTDNGQRPRLPVRTRSDIPLAKFLEAMEALDSVIARGPVRAGDTIVADLLGLGVDLIASDDLPRGDNHA